MNRLVTKFRRANQGNVNESKEMNLIKQECYALKDYIKYWY